MKPSGVSFSLIRLTSVAAMIWGTWLMAAVISSCFSGSTITHLEPVHFKRDNNSCSFVSGV
jgi:hypothetical protein